MPLIQHNVENLLGGVSQQAAGSRYPSQCSEQINAAIMAVEGLTKRPGSAWEGAMTTAPTSALAAWHTINRDSSEQYFVSVEVGDPEDRLKVWNLNAPGPTVAIDAPSVAYLATDNPVEDIRFFTFDDYTFILNRSIEVSLTAAVTKADGTYDTGYWAVIWLDQGNYQSSFNIQLGMYLGQTRSVTISTGDGTGGVGLQALNTNTLIADFVTAFTTEVPPALPSTQQAAWTISPTPTGSPDLWDEGNWSITQSNNFLFIRRADPRQDFYCAVDDTQGVSMMNMVKDEVTNFTELPAVCQHDIVATVVGDKNQKPYYVKFVATAGSGIGRGTWIECAAPNIQYVIDPATMPHVLVREDDGTFTFSACNGYTDIAPAWGNRIVGDEDTNASPSFVGQSIDAVTFFQSRLVLTSGENVCLSETGNPFNFWRTTVLDLPDSERIDVSASHNKVNLIRWAIPIQQRLVLVSDRTQFVLTGDVGITPTNISLTVGTEFEADMFAKPQTKGNAILLPSFDGTYGGLRELVDRSSYKQMQFEVVPISATVPKYVVGRPRHLSVGEQSGYVAVLGSHASFRDRVYIYNWLENGGERVQSSWHTWIPVESGGAVLHAEFIGTKLWLAIQRGAVVTLESIETRALQDVDSSGQSIHLDRQFTEADLLDLVYDDLADATIVTFPYEPEEDGSYPGGIPRGVIRTPAGSYEVGDQLPVLSQSGSFVTFSGDLTGLPILFGESFTFSYEFSPAYLQRDMGRGLRPIIAGRLSLRYLNLLLEDTGSLSVRCLYDAATEIINEVVVEGDALVSENRRIPVFSRNLDVLIQLLNYSPKPIRLTTMTFESSYKSKSRGSN